MKTDPVVIFGLLITLTLSVLGNSKKLRNDRSLLILGAITVAMAVIAMALRQPGNPRINRSDIFLGPLVYVAAYAALRWLNKRIYHREPTFAWHFWYDHEEGREQNWLDIATHAVPFMAAFGAPALVTRWLG